MSVFFATEPAGGRDALAAGLSVLGASGMPSLAAHAAAVAGAQAPPPLPVYHFSLDDLAAGHDPRGGSPIAWKYLLLCADQPVRTADIQPSPSGVLEFAAISGAEARAISNAIEKAEKEVVVEGGHELRLAQIPSLYVTALWLHAQDPNLDRFIMIPPAPEGFHGYAIHSAPDFLQGLRQAASNKIRARSIQTAASPTN